MTSRLSVFPVMCPSEETGAGLAPACWPDQKPVRVLSALGARRRALANARLRDVDFEHGVIRLVEKGRKVLTKPVPDEYVTILRAAGAAGIWKSPDAYLIPNRRAGAVRCAERPDKVIWETVRKVAARVGVHAHVHSLRAAFAVQFDEANPDQLIALKE